MRLLTALASLLVLLTPTLASAEDYLGEWKVEGRMGRRKVAASIKIKKDSEGKISIEREARFTARSRANTPAFLWKAKSVKVINAHHIRATFERPMTQRGMLGAMRGSEGETKYYVFKAFYYARSNGKLTEYIVNTTKTKDHSFWRRSSMRGKKDMDDCAKLVGKLSKLAEGLYYVSETDAEVTPKAFKDKGNVKLKAFMKLVKKPADRPAALGSFDDEYEQMTDFDEDDEDQADDAKRFKKLLDTFKKNVKDIRVFRIGDEWASKDRRGTISGGIHVYIVGKSKDGHLIVLETFSVET